MILECHNCDNCKEREKDKPDLCNVIADALRLVRIIKVLLQHAAIQSNNIYYITRDDIVDIFYGNKNNNVTKKNLIIIQVIDLQRVHSESSVLTHSCKIVEICENAENIITSMIWQQFLK
ncbi:162_t:CDS:2 [Funneliformis caledonium]|uniref:162_t:CDS:1 n=1 Tax=Funneliformis caledonium TaxID=1117310 RepID=A0A9N9HQ86_9GLOM|nr:162_t:CDS:2 [Funneliformis caledonium]